MPPGKERGPNSYGEYQLNLWKIDTSPEADPGKEVYVSKPLIAANPDASLIGRVSTVPQLRPWGQNRAAGDDD